MTGPFETLVDHFRAVLRGQPETRIFRFLLDGEGEPLSLTNAELDLRARALAVALRERVPAGQRALILCPPGLDYVAAFFAALYAGVIAVPVYPPEPALLKRALPRLLAVIADAQPAIVLAPRFIAAMADQFTELAPALKSLTWLTVDDVDLAAADGWRRPVVSGQDTAFLQYTSGSTGVPKGVVVRHDNLLHNLDAIHRLFVGSDVSTHSVSWLPPYHDMGLIGGLLQPAYGAIPVTFMAPLAFLKRPSRWLRAISDYGATHSGGPDFAYELCVARIPAAEREQFDLSSWTLAFTGAEFVRSETINRFAQAFESSGFRRRAFYPCYGLAEGTLIVSGGDRRAEPVTRTLRAEALTRHLAVEAGADDNARTIVGCGRSIPGQSLLIVEPESRTLCGEGQIGEVWVSGPSVAGGYWGRPEETEEVFSARLADPGEGPFLRTGDLGFLDGAELFVTGRRKDLIVIAGRNHYPQDIERSVEGSDPALRPGCGVACSLDVDNAERLVIIYEVDGNPASLDTDRVIASIRTAVTAEHDLSVHDVVLVRRGKVPKTSSGKLRRSACLAAYLDGSLDSVASYRMSTKDTPALGDGASAARPGVSVGSPEIERWLIEAVANRLGVPPATLDTRAPTVTYGLSSVDMVGITGELEQWLGRELPAILMWEHPTIEALADFVAVPAPDEAPRVKRSSGARAVAEPIAIIGIGCRFPGGADNPASYWRMLCDGYDAVSEVPADRWRAADFLDDDPAAPGKTTTRWGGFLDGVDRFDPRFFGISPREAARMDPQQRLLAEVAWEALEDAGVASHRLAGSPTGVFIGIATNDYGHLQMRDLDGIDAFSGTGNALSIAANRLSYLFDLRGPSMAIDTACSSSLVAVHQACASLALGACSLAIAGGVNLIFSPALAINFSKAGAMAPDGRCKAFDARANGYVRSEGAGIVVLKPLDQALADQDRVYGVILGGAVNQDGRTNGLMAPSRSAQEAVLRTAYGNAGVAPERVHYVEAHGTGTLLGDPIEAAALSTVVSGGRDPGAPCVIGSVKSNLGHLEAAAGIAGLVKATLMVHHRMVPPSLHYQQPNPHIPFGDLRLEVATSLRPWPSADGPALVGVSSFGFGGTNAHLVVRAAPVAAAAVAVAADEPAAPGVHVLPISARDPDALRDLAAKYDVALAQSGNEITPRDLCFAAAVRRVHHEYRFACVGSSLAELREALAEFGRGEGESGPSRGDGGRTGSSRRGSGIGRRPKVVFLFSGQGPRWWPLAADLLSADPLSADLLSADPLSAQPAVGEVLGRCDELLRRHVDWSLLEQLTLAPERSRLSDPAVGQPALCAVQVALAALWRSWGVEPGAVVGHSVGEIAAAHVAGALSLDEALGVAVHRGRVLQPTVGHGTMAVAAVSFDRARQVLLDLKPGPVWVAASNGPMSTVFSGEAEALNLVATSLTADGVFCRVLDSVEFASHSPRMDPVLSGLRQSLAGLRSRPPTVPMVSTVTGQLIDGEHLDAGYWAANLRQPVLFDQAVASLIDSGHDTFVEISAHAMLSDDVAERLTVQRADGAVVASLRRDEPGRPRLLAALGQLYQAGFPVDWGRIYGSTGPMVGLPSYAWQRQRYWLDDTRVDSVKSIDGASRAVGDSRADGVSRADDDSLLYQLEWQRTETANEATVVEAAHTTRTWLVLADNTGVGDALAALIAQRGSRCVQVVPGDECDFVRLLDSLKLAADEGLQVVHLWSLNGCGSERDSAGRGSGDLMLRAQEDTCMSAVRVVQALVKARSALSTSLWLVTRGAVRAAEPSHTPLAIGQSTLWGLGRSLQQEHSGIWGGLIDLDPEAMPQANASRLLDEISRAGEDRVARRGREDQIALRGDRTYVARLVRTRLPSSPARGDMWRPDASYLITGGLGGLGLAVARSMVLAGARRLVLIGRTAIPPRGEWADLPKDDPATSRVAAVRELESLGASIIVASVDVSDEDGVRDFLGDFDRAGWPAIRGIVHAAGVGEVAPMLDLELADLERHLRPKVVGAWVLHRLFADRPLDFFVLFSSTSSILSSPFVASYAAANAFLDALAQSRRDDHKPGLSINWGIWSGMGLAAGRDEAILSRGMGTLVPEQALRVFHRLLRHDQAQVAVVPVEWAQWGRRYQDLSGSLLLTALVEQGAGQPLSQFPSRGELLDMPQAERLTALIEHLLVSVTATLGFPPSSVRADQPLLELGLDSLLAVELRNVVERQLGVSLPISVLLAGASVRSLAEQIVERLSDGATDHSGPVLTASVEKVFPLSEMQRSIWFFEQLKPNNPAYVIPAAVRIRGQLDAGVLLDALNEIVRRHDVLRTTFQLREGTPMQIVRGQVALHLSEVDTRVGQDPEGDLEPQAADRALAHRIAEALSEPFDLGAGPLLRFTLLRVGTDEYVLAVAMHHLISDGWSAGLVVSELSAIYQAFIAGRPSPLPELTIQYGDFAIWQRQWLGGESLAQDLTYWRQHLAGAPAVLTLPLDRPRPAIQGFRGGSVPCGLPEPLLRELGLVAKARGATTYMALLAAFQILLHRYSGQDDVVVGVPVANRDRAEIEPLIGCFVNMLAIRTDLSGDPGFGEVLERVRDGCLGAYVHQRAPFGTVVADLKPARDLSTPPIFQVCFSYQSDPVRTHAMAGIELRRTPLTSQGARFDLELQLLTDGAGVSGWFEYDRDLFDESTIARMAEHFQRLAERAVARPELPVGQLEMLDDADWRQLMDGNATGRVWADAGWLHEGVQEQTRRNPRAEAVRCAGRGMSYGELNRRANQLAHRLRRLGVGRDVLVGVSMPRSLDLVVSLLAVLKAGGAFVPLDPAYPVSRLDFMLHDTQISVLLTQRGVAQGLPPIGADVDVLCVDELGSELAAESGDDVDAQVNGEDLAYVIYTSGSTGRPKGVMNTHAGIRNRLLWMLENHGLTESDRVLQKTPVSFDVSVWEFFWPLMAGATLVMARPDGHKDSRYLVDTIRGEGITALHFVPSMLRVLVEEPGLSDCPSLRLVFCSGEALSRDLQERFFARSRARLLNLYGPTEAAIEVSAWECRRDGDPRGVPIGFPIANTQLYILDRYARPVPVGVVGELHIAGMGLARGYLNQPELTAQKFITRPLGQGPAVRMFRTGDLARFRSDGAIEFLGRLDRQIKLRGIRVELGEIESALVGHERVVEAVVTAHEYRSGDVRLVAYLTGDGQLDTVDLAGYLRQHLPDYLIPAAFIVLPALPLMPNGKVDHAALPEPNLGRPDLRTPYAAPTGDLEGSIADIWRDLLGVEQIGVHDNFFDLGGHSLLMAHLKPRVAAALGREVSMMDLFQYPTVGSLAGYLSQPDAPPTPPMPATVDRTSDHRQAQAKVAIIGMAGRFPGAADVEAFWDNLAAGRSGIAFVSDEDLRTTGVAPALLRQENYIKAKGVLADADLFDAGFFGYSPREAEMLDPQQRAFLECAWEALESAGCDPRTFDGRIGVFGGASASTYLLFNLLAGPQAGRSASQYETLLANDKDFLATRVSYKLDLRGPSFTIQNACSTSLTAVHVACQSLLHGECDIALAGGVSITVPLLGGYEHVQGGILSSDGLCRAFDADADGTVAGNGVGIVVLRRLIDATANGDTVAAVICASAINNDGSLKASYTAPSVEAQAAVITAALAVSDVDPATIGYVETHGTGTPIGDAVEIAALTRAFRAHTSDTGYCAIGSVKTSVGHLDAAAGITSLIKTVLSLKYEAIPASLNFTRPNPELALDTSPFFVNTELRPWPRREAPRRAAVSSFGFGGTNVHMIVEEAPAVEPRCAREAPAAGPQCLLPLSGRTAPALAANAHRLADYLERHPDADLADVAFTLARRRRPFERRQTVVCRDSGEAVSALRALSQADAVTAAGHSAGHQAPVAFLFPGQGAQYVGMARDLYSSEPVFAVEVDRCARLFETYLGEDLRTLLFADPGQADAAATLTQTAIAQPALFTVEYALARLWWAWGVRPQAMAGHSIGEYVAACLAGVFSLADAVRLVAARGRLVQSMPTGAMVAVLLPERQTVPWLGEDLCLAAVNSTALCVVSGPVDAVDDFRRRLTAAGVTSRRLHTSHAFHSSSMDGAVEPFVNEARKVTLNAPRIPFCSTVTGTWITDQQATSPEYWGTHLRQTVRFADAIETILADPALVPLEVGPGQTLRNFVREHQAWDQRRTVLGSLRHPHERRDDREYLLHSLGALWSAGVPVDWAGYFRGEERRLVELPTYAFQRQRYWVAASGQEGHEPGGATEVADSSTVVDDWLYTPGWRRLAPQRRQAPGDPQTAWVVLGAELGLGRQLADRLETGGGMVVRVTAGDQFTQDGDRSWSLDVGSREQYAGLVDALNTLGAKEIRIAHLWSLGCDPAERLDEAQLDRARRLGLDSLLALAQAIGDARPPFPIAIDVLSRGLYSVTDDERLQPENATLLGACLVIPQEVPDVTCRTLDISGADPRDPSADTVRAVHALISRSTDDGELALRGQHWWVRGFDAAELDLNPDSRTTLRDGGVYLITGGLGGVGLELAQHIADSVDSPVLGLLSRSEPPAEESWARDSPDVDGATGELLGRLWHLRDRGARVVILQADVTDLDQTTQAVARLRSQFGPLNGVIHAAGVPSHSLIMRKSTVDVDRVLAAKTRGTLVLDQVCRDDGCDFVLLCSSNSTVLGGPCQSDYGGANAFLDVFAAWKRRETGMPVSAIVWESWRGVGMAANLTARVSFGMRPGSDPSGAAEPVELARSSALGPLRALSEGMSAAEGVAAFARILAAPSLPEQLVVSRKNLAAMRRLARSITPALLAREAEQIAPSGSKHPRPDLDTPYLAPATDEEIAVAAIWQDILGIDQVGLHDDLFALGGHSLVAVQIGAKIQQRFGVRLDLREFFDASTVADIVATLAAARPKDGVTRGTIAVLHRDEPDDGLDGLSDEDVEARLHELLAAELAEQGENA